MDRRDFLKTVLGGAAALAVGRIAGAGEGKGKGKATRPPETCGGYVDADADGVCERSVEGKRLCGKTACPAHGKNPARAELKEKGAPRGTCALWSDPDKKGWCARSEAGDGKRCAHTTCPAHKDRPKPGA